MLKSPNPNDLDPYNSQCDVAIDLSSKLLRSKLISILFKIRDMVYVQITNISLASRLMCRARSLTAVTSHRLEGEIRCTLSSDIISYACMHLKGINRPSIFPALITLGVNAKEASRLNDIVGGLQLCTNEAVCWLLYIMVISQWLVAAAA